MCTAGLTTACFTSPHLEHALRRAVARFPGVKVFIRHEVEALSQDESLATLSVRSIEDNAVRDVRAAWIIGCDGALSLVRNAIGSGHADLGMHQP